MSGSLIKIDEEIVTSAVASVTLGGSDWDNSYDVYMVKFNNVTPDTDIVNLSLRFTVSGSADTSSNYDRAFKNLSSNSSFLNTSGTNTNFLDLGLLGTGTSEQSNGILYLFNFNNASEYSFCTIEQSFRNNDGNLRGYQGGAVLTVTQATDGVQFFFSSGNIDTGSKFTLYGLKK
jgi:hypothetical protein